MDGILLTVLFAICHRHWAVDNTHDTRHIIKAIPILSYYSTFSFVGDIYFFILDLSNRLAFTLSPCSLVRMSTSLKREEEKVEYCIQSSTLAVDSHDNNDIFCIAHYVLPSAQKYILLLWLVCNACTTRIITVISGIIFFLLLFCVDASTDEHIFLHAQCSTHNVSLSSYVHGRCGSVDSDKTCCRLFLVHFVRLTRLGSESDNIAKQKAIISCICYFVMFCSLAWKWIYLEIGTLSKNTKNAHSYADI